MLDIAIVGGGLGGLALAAGLTRKGYKAHVFEAAPQLRTSTATLIGLGKNSFTALDALHPQIVPLIRNADRLARAGTQHGTCHVVYSYRETGIVCQKNTRVVRVSKNEPPQVNNTGAMVGRHYNVRWGEVQRVLASLVPEDHVQCNHRATGYTEHADDGFATVHFKNQADVSARLVVAADGVRSALRAVMLPNDPGPRYLGHMNWNALLYNPDCSVADVHAPGEVQGWVDSPVMGGFKHFGFVIDAGGGYTFWQLCAVSKQPQFTQPPGPKGVVHGDEQPHLVAGGLGRPGSKAHVMELLESVGFDSPLKAVEATPEKDIFERALMDRIPLDELGGHMSSAGGRVVLLGDAAHAMHPVPGQGARTSFEDAHALAAALDKHRGELGKAGWTFHASNGQHSRQGSDLPVLRTVVSEYEAARLTRTCRIQRVAAESCGLESIKQPLRPKGLTPQQEMQRYLEFYSWLDQYPDNPSGDPQSTFWKPTSKVAASVLREA